MNCPKCHTDSKESEVIETTYIYGKGDKYGPVEWKLKCLKCNEIFWEHN